MISPHPPDDIPDIQVVSQHLDEVRIMQAARIDINRFAPLYDRYAPRIYAYCLRRVRNREEACDLRLPHVEDAPFHKVTLTFLDGHIGSIRFQCSDLYVGDLVRQWGRPDEINRVPAGYMLRWNQKGITAIASGTHWFNYRLPVETIIRT